MKIELHSAEQVADTLGVEVDTLYRYARKGRIHGMKVGKAWRFLDEDLEEFLQKQRYPAKTHALKATLLPETAGSAANEAGARVAATSGGGEACYADVETASSLLAESLLRHGVTAGDRVLVLLSNSLEFVVGCFAAWKAGAVVVPENPAIKDADLRVMLQDSPPQALIVDRDVAERLEAHHCELRNVRVVYIKNRTFTLSGLDAMRVESLDAVLECKGGSKVLRLDRSSHEHFAAPVLSA
jgi:excisionase family DNA binding protein